MIVRIKDKEASGSVIVGFPRIFKILEYVKNDYEWFLLYLNGSACKGVKLNEHCQEINSSESGISLGWNDMVSLLNKMDQIYDLLVVGVERDTKINRVSDEDLFSVYPLVINCFDSSYWEVKVDKKELAELFVSEFKSIEFLSVINKVLQEELKE